MKQRVYREPVTAPGLLMNGDELLAKGEVTIHPYENELTLQPTQDRAEEATIPHGTYGADCWIVIEDESVTDQLIIFYAARTPLTLEVFDQRYECTLRGPANRKQRRWDLQLRQRS